MQTPLDHLNFQSKIQQNASSRILYDVPCKVCRDHSSGKHYGIFACDGCAGFFKRSIRRNRQYICKAKAEGSCVVDKTHRNQCRACRLRKCVEAGMNKDAVQHERGPRNSTLRRQMALYFQDSEPSPPIPSVLDLALPKISSTTSSPPRIEAPSQLPPPPFVYPPTAFPKIPLTPPSILLANTETVCESAARLLFMNVKWAKNVPAFTSLSIKDQMLLIEESWGELFVLGAAQFLPPMELTQLLCAAATRDMHKARSIVPEITNFQETLFKLRNLQLDAHEYACLRAIVLFKTAVDSNSNNSSGDSESSGRSVRDVAAVAALQDHTQLTLSKYISAQHPTQPFRFGKLLLLLPALRAISTDTIEELFFRDTIGHIPIERIICDMYKSNEL
nr:PREDICTED: nuclear receptor subfamily 2 group E member 1 [Bemisia tabaci]